jgi:membrane protein implicated in regulation of membrane protease activity
MDWLRDHMWETWLGLAMLLGVAELFSLDLVLLMLATGALVGMVTALVGLPIAAQIIAAVLASVAALALARPSMVRRLHSGPELRHGPAALVGQEGFVTAELTPEGGQIKLAGEIWTARPYDEMSVVPVGAKVQVLEIRGATAYVHEIAQLEG